ncbi:MAG: hypothetical protein AB7J32_07885 [Pseudonocardia sp.]
MSPALKRARTDLAAAGQLATAGFALQAVACAFRAARHAADAALLAIGETRATDAGTVGAFVQRVVRHRGLDPKAGQLLRSLHNRALLAYVSYDQAPPDEADTAVRDATAVVDAVAAWLEEPVRTANGHVTRRAAPVRPRERPARRRR